MEKNINKNIGDTNISVTKEKFMKEKEQRIKQKSLEAISNLNKLKNEKLSKDDDDFINKVMKLYQDNSICKSDKLLIHFIEEKLKLTETYKIKQNQVKKLQMELLEKINDMSNEVMASKSNLDYINKMILDHCKNKSQDHLV